MKMNIVIDEVVKEICHAIDHGEFMEEEKADAQGFEKIKNKAENVQAIRESDDTGQDTGRKRRLQSFGWFHGLHHAGGQGKDRRAGIRYVPWTGASGHAADG